MVRRSWKTLRATGNLSGQSGNSTRSYDGHTETERPSCNSQKLRANSGECRYKSKFRLFPVTASLNLRSKSCERYGIAESRVLGRADAGRTR